MLEASSFSQNKMPTDKFDVKVERLRVGDNPATQENLTASYELNGEPSLFLEIAPNSNHWIGLPTVGASGVRFPTETELLTVRSFWGSDGQHNVKLVPRLHPMLLSFTSDQTFTAEAVLVNGPDMFFRPSEMTFSNNKHQFVLSEFHETFDTRRKLKQDKGQADSKIPTGIVKISTLAGNPMTAEEVYRAIYDFSKFLKFARGNTCGIGNIIGYSKTGDKTFGYLGFSRSDGFQGTRNWYGIGVVNELSAVFERFSNAMEDEQDGEALNHILEFYRSSNAIKDTSSEMAVVASHAALETAVSHILETRGNWSRQLLNSTVPFADKLRAATAIVGLASNPLDNLEHLMGLSEARSNIDGFALITLFRNRIVHRDRKFKYEGIQLYEIWQLSQWLCELFVFYLIGYSGQMVDRRMYAGRSGGTVPVPLA